MTYQFDSEIAKCYGVNQAIIINNLAFWIRKNAANGKHIYEGNVWTYNSIKAFTELFPFWTVSQIRHALESLSQSGVVLKGNFNENAHDRTCWYALSADILDLLGLSDEINRCILQNSQKGFRNIENGVSKNPECIIGTDNKTQIIKPDSGKATEFLKSNFPFRWEQFLMQYKTALGADFEKVLTDFDFKVVEEKKEWDQSILFARLERLSTNWLSKNRELPTHGNNSVDAAGPKRKFFDGH